MPRGLYYSRPGSMHRLLVIAVCALAAVLAAPAGAAPRTLWPGVTYELGIQFTPRGPVAIHVLRGPRPGGLTTLEPVLSNETIVGRETLTSMQRRLASRATSAGVNGDYFTFATGRPSGVLLRDGGLVTPPNASRASAGITTDGRLDVRRASFLGSWRGLGGTRIVRGLNAPPTTDGSALYTDAYGPATPALPGSVAVVLFPFPTATPDVDLVAPVVETRVGGGAVSIPAGGAVLLARGQSAAAVTAEAPAGTTMTVRLSLRPTWPGVLSAFGGGPQLVRNGVPLYRSGEKFTTSQLGPRAPRSAVGQLADGRIVLVAVDGRQPGYSIGLTSFELAQTLVRFGAVTGMGLDSGGSTTMAFDGTLLNRPSDGRERSISTAVMLMYRGVFAPEPPPLVSPNGDGVAESPELGYRIMRPSSVTVTLRAPAGAPPLTLDGVAPAGHVSGAVPADGRGSGARNLDPRRERGRRPRPGVGDDEVVRRGRHAGIPPRPQAARSTTEGSRDRDHVALGAPGARLRDRARLVREARTAPPRRSKARRRRPAGRVGRPRREPPASLRPSHDPRRRGE